MSTKEAKTNVSVDSAEEVITKPVVKEKLPKSGMALAEKFVIKDKDGRNAFSDEEALAEATLMSVEETKDFIGGRDPMKYFKKGRLPEWMKKELGQFLEEDRMEVETLRKVAANIPDLIMFKHNIYNIYNIVVPKHLSELALDHNGEFVDQYAVCHRVAINFNAAVKSKKFGITPPAFEPSYFAKYIEPTLNLLKLKSDSTRFL